MKFVPGLALACAMAGASIWGSSLLAKTSVPISALLLVIILGILMGSLWNLPDVLQPGLKIAQKGILRLGVALLGLKLSLLTLGQLGVWGYVYLTLVTALAFLPSLWLGRKMGLTDSQSLLLGVGGSICGASAIAAAETVVEGEPKETTVGLAVITLWGCIAVVLYSLVAHSIGFSTRAYGVFNGATLQEMAHVVAGASALGPESEKVAVVAKLWRVAMLAPMIVGLGWYLSRTKSRDGSSSTGSKAALVPWFMVGFLVLSIVRTIGDSQGFGPLFKTLDPMIGFVLAVGMAGVGLKTSFKDVASGGVKPVLFGLVHWLYIVGLALGLGFILPGILR